MSSRNAQNQSTSDLAEALKLIISYINDKGQLPRLDVLILVKIGFEALARYFDLSPNEIINFEELIRLSIHAPAVSRPLWLQAISEISKINTKTEIVTELRKGKRLE